MRVLITGGAGFVGSHLTESFLSDGHDVTVVDNLSTGTRVNFTADTFTADALTFIQHDVTKPLPVDPVYDVVCHLASIPTPGQYMQSPIQTLRAGSRGTEHTLSLAADSNATFLLASTSEVYGNPEIHPQPEAYNGNVDPYGPRSSYDESKRYAESLVRAYHETKDVDTRIARIFNTYGPRMRDDRVIPAFITQAIEDRDLTVEGNGHQTRSFCYIDDLIRCLRELIDSDYAQPLNIGNPHEVSILNLARTIQNQLDTTAGITRTERTADDPERRQPDISTAKEVLDWAPRVGLSDGIQRTADARQSYHEPRE
jgi:dTDP-glucose 4,6-dehydratase